MKIIRKKTNPDQFDPIYVGKKKYDFRLADFEIAEDGVHQMKPGDLLVISFLFVGVAISRSGCGSGLD